jgi:trk system potassium uptake protein TrkA
MKMLIVGCGRIGADVAQRLSQSGHEVVVIDPDAAAFNRLPADFSGRTVEGDSLSQAVLERAGIETADGLAAVTSSDTLNGVIAHIAHLHYRVPNVVVRNYDPALRPMLEMYGLQIISSSAWGSQRMEELLEGIDIRTIFSAGNGEVEIYEMGISADWEGQPLQALFSAGSCIPVALTRDGVSILPGKDTVLKEKDLLTVSATRTGINELRACLIRKEA